MLSVIAISLMIMTIGIVLRKPLLRAVFGAVEDDVMSNALTYFTITVVSYPFIAIHDASAALLLSLIHICFQMHCCPVPGDPQAV